MNAVGSRKHRPMTMTAQNGTKHSITPQQLGDVFEYWLWPGECNAPEKTFQ